MIVLIHNNKEGILPTIGRKIMRPEFREKKTIEAVVFLIKRHNGEMNYMKLIKLLYLADREALLTLGRPITYDRYVSMDQGPVLSHTLNKINEGDPPGIPSTWSRHISAPHNYAVRLIMDLEPWELSDAEIDILSNIYRQYGHMDKWELVGMLHEILPEWQDPNGSSLPILYQDILQAGGMSDAEIRSIETELEVAGAFEVA